MIMMNDENDESRFTMMFNDDVVTLCAGCVIVRPSAKAKGVAPSKSLPVATESRKLFLSWRNAAKLSCESFIDAAESLSQPVGGSGSDDGQASLLVVPAAASSPHADGRVRVMFVHWDNPVTPVGKPLQLDANNCIINVPNFVKSQERFCEASIVHKAIGSRMRKLREDREQVMPNIRRLKELCETFISPVRNFEMDDEHCFVCAHGMTHVSTDATHSDASLMGTMKCMFCLLASHRACCDQLMTQIQEFKKESNNSAAGKFVLRVSGFTLDMVPAILFTEPGSQVVAGSFELSLFSSNIRYIQCMLTVYA